MIVAHFSDVHALSLEGVSPLSFLSKRIAGGLNVILFRRDRHPVALFEALVDDLNAVKPDHVIVTGDLTNLSLAPELSLSRSILDRIALGPDGVSVVPGNHDVYVLSAWLGRTFERAFAPYLTSDDPHGAGETPFPVERVRGEIAVIGLSTALPSPVMLADGWVGKAQLDALEAALTRHAGRFRIVALHHPPFANRHALWRGLRDRGRLRAVLQRAGAELVLHGHEHRDVRSAVAGPHGSIPVVGVGSATYADPSFERRARYNLYRIEGGKLLSVETRVHDPATGRYRC